MDNESTAIIYVPVGKRVFTVGEIPVLLAAARWPHVDGHCIAYPLRIDAPGTRGSALTNEDMGALNAIWGAAGLPHPEYPMPLEDWQRYVAAFNESAQKPSWDLWQCLQSAGLDNAILRAAAEESHASDLQGAIACGEISARDPLTHRPVAVSDVRVQLNHEQLLLSREDFVKFARGAMLEVAEGGAEQASLSGTDGRPPATSEIPVVRPGRRRVDAIGREIEAAIARIKSRDTGAIINQHTVMAELVGSHGQGASCITGHTANGDAVTWATDGGKARKLDKDALRKRLQAQIVGG